MRTDKVDTHLGKRITVARLAAGLSLSQLAGALEISELELDQIEQGQVRIRALQIARLSRRLGQSIGWFYHGLPGQAAFEPSPKKG